MQTAYLALLDLIHLAYLVFLAQLVNFLELVHPYALIALPELSQMYQIQQAALIVQPAIIPQPTVQFTALPLQLVITLPRNRQCKFHVLWEASPIQPLRLRASTALWDIILGLLLLKVALRLRQDTMLMELI